MKHEKTLVIVDMQNYFLRGSDYGDLSYMIPTFTELILHAMKNQWGIILLEFSSCGETAKEITSILQNYDRKVVLEKEEQSGAKLILDFLISNGWWPTDLIVCGLYGDECVYRTVNDLLGLSDSIKISIIDDMVYPPYPYGCDDPPEESLTFQKIISKKDKEYEQAIN